MLEVFKTDCLRVIKKKLDYRRSLKAVKKAPPLKRAAGLEDLV